MKIVAKVFTWAFGLVAIAIAAVAVALALPARLVAVEDSAAPGSAEQAATQIEKGRYLARAGNCVACHTVAGQAEYTGGRRIGTPFGDVFSSNLTPDESTGLGRWSRADFWRAMHHGQSRDGRLLYPAFPYTHYTRVSREDSDAIYAWLQSLPAVNQAARPHELRFPYDTAFALRIWRAIYFKAGEYEADASRSTQWNRGAYLVEGLGHCGACHTVRTSLGGSRQASAYAGGPIPTLGWDALPLVSDTPIDDAQAAQMIELLHTGTSARDVASGPMAEVVFHSLQYLDRADIEAMVDYIRTLPARPAPEPVAMPRVSERYRRDLMSGGAKLYGQHCAECHGDDGQGRDHAFPALAGNRLVTAPSANNALRSVLYGGYAPSTAAVPRPYGMPPYQHQLTPDEIAAVLSYVRGSWGNAASAVSAEEVRRQR
ncbi:MULTISPECIES: cytochrome c [Hydrocarboniphaga]|jgi:mono/diheme cytochrome c family protein|uniref:cytochrome c n=2 Tax=Nevskiaceae TaxID=568386 RepID=UPI002ABC673C|nr:cytochrome c [Hydrocarboniphaga sp.]MDZ4077230.1 cytochrome c [Hydrocarboniphaga sp.]